MSSLLIHLHNIYCSKCGGNGAVYSCSGQSCRQILCEDRQWCSDLKLLQSHFQAMKFINKFKT